MPSRKRKAPAKEEPSTSSTSGGVQTRGSTRTRGMTATVTAATVVDSPNESGNHVLETSGGSRKRKTNKTADGTTPPTQTPPSKSEAATKKKPTKKAYPKSIPKPRTVKGRVTKLKGTGKGSKPKRSAAPRNSNVFYPVVALNRLQMLPVIASSSTATNNTLQQPPPPPGIPSTTPSQLTAKSTSAAWSNRSSHGQNLPPPTSLPGPTVVRQQVGGTTYGLVIQTMGQHFGIRGRRIQPRHGPGSTLHPALGTMAVVAATAPAQQPGPSRGIIQFSSRSNPVGTSQGDLTKFPLPVVGLVPPRPPQFQEHLERTLTSLSTYKPFPLKYGSKEFETISRLIAPLCIKSLVQIANPDLWQRYFNARKEMLRIKSNDLDLLSGLFPGEKEVLRGARLSKKFNVDPRLKTKAGKYSPNETLLFHCTKDEQNLERILSQGLDERLSSDNRSLFGKGIYFSDNPLKSVQYDGTTGTLLIFAVLLGDCLFTPYDPAKRSSVREPEKANEQKRSWNDQFFDSITSNGAVGGYNEYVIYNRHQCVPMYSVKYYKLINPQARDDARGEPPYAKARVEVPAIAWRHHANQGNLSMPNQNLDGSWPCFTSSVFKAMGVAPEEPFGSVSSPRPSTSGEYSGKAKKATSGGVLKSTAKQECPICCNEYGAFINSPHLWKTLSCRHRLCLDCHKHVEKSGTTMVGVPCTFLKCPFCHAVTGTQVGDCPNGQMSVKVIDLECEGYRGHPTIQINYLINDGKYYTHRIAYLPNTPEGKAVMNLLKVAWNRRLCFVIGDSITSGAKDVPVWNIHHKTSIRGGVSCYGYPDPGYLDRVRAELKAYGIE